MIHTLFLILSINLLIPDNIKVASGKVIRIENFMSEYVTARHVDIWLPQDYDQSKSYATLYMHDGQMLFDATHTWNQQEWGVDEKMTQLLQKNKIKETIVVGIWSSPTRHADYFPQKPFEQLPQSVQDSLYQVQRDENTPLFATKVQSDNYLKFLVKELKPYMDENFATKGNRENTFIAGSSMGGLISMYALCEYPKIFGGAACLSTHWVGSLQTENNPIPRQFIEYLEQNLPKAKKHKLYFDFGTETLDTLYEPYQNQVDEVMKNKGYKEPLWKTLKFEGADHSEKSWNQRLHIPLTFLLKN